jgi:hypothetical protein
MTGRTDRVPTACTGIELSIDGGVGRSIAATAPATKHRTEPIQAFTLTFK